MVVPVFITNCQVSEKLNSGPEIPQTMSTTRAITNAQEVPVAFVALSENRSSIKPIPDLLLRLITKPPLSHSRCLYRRQMKTLATATLTPVPWQMPYHSHPQTLNIMGQPLTERRRFLETQILPPLKEPVDVLQTLRSLAEDVRLALSRHCARN